MKEHVVDLDHDSQRRRVAVDRAVGKQGRVFCDARLAIDAHDFFNSGQHQEQPDIRVLEDIPHRIHPAVSFAVGDQDSPVI